ncbi:DUF4123 domain-containing protein [Paraburkholderia caribensis]|uniref:DUF4123 domain-containing protein n=1 Tax=Paraburkholderia caribensis TaxID=75105 RepID=UPI001D097505|nr:DUF4123 domain-containing protein [Paraburkholderia caribensis]
MSIEDFDATIQTLPTEPPLHFYLIADAAQDSRHPSGLTESIPDTRSQCLLTYHQGADLEAAAPHLMSFPQFDVNAKSWQWLAGYGAAMPAAVSVIASPLNFEALFAHLHAFTEVVLPDGDEMIFAFWDPAILGTLFGQQDDDTLHVPGPVLTSREREQFLAGMSAWWYWDRTRKIHQVVPNTGKNTGKRVSLPLRITQTQVDMLVEASVPDHILGYIRMNKPGILSKVPDPEQYPRVEQHLQEARRLNLLGMQDIVNYVCAGIIYGSHMQESIEIERLLEKVRSRQISLTEALEQFP